MLPLTKSITYSQARNQLASVLDRVVKDKEIVTIQRRGKTGVCLIAEEELASILETLYLLRSPENARRLFESLEEVERLKKVRLEPQSIDELCQELGIEREKSGTDI